MVWHTAVDVMVDSSRLRGIRQGASDGYLISPVSRVDEGDVGIFKESLVLVWVFKLAPHNSNIAKTGELFNDRARFVARNLRPHMPAHC